MTAKIIPVADFGQTWNVSKRYAFDPDGIAPCVLANCWKDPIKVVVEAIE